MSKKLQILGLVEVTSQRQADNGTQCFHDPITGCDYMSYESGYVRRQYSTLSWRTGKKLTTIYQLNKKRMAMVESSWTPGTFWEKTERVLEMNADARLDMIARAAINYRNTVKSYTK